MSLVKLVLTTGVLLGFVASGGMSAHGALDCAKARKAPDATVCKHRDLMRLDAELTGLWFAYERVPFLMGASGARQDEHREFEHKRAACGSNSTCLQQVYRARVDALKISIAQAMDNIRREENEGPPTFPGVLPAPLEAVVAGYAHQCRALGGTLTGPSRPDVLASDVDRDERADYVLNPQNLKCSAAATAFCGNGGCQITIAFSADGYKQPLTVLGGQPTLVQTPTGTRVEVWVDRSNCKLESKEQACWEVISYKEGKLHRQFETRRVD